MMNSILKFGALSLLVTAIAGLPLQLSAASTNKPAATKTTSSAKSESGEKKRSGGGVHGKLLAVDKVAKTVSLGKYTYQVTSETKIFKDGKPARLEDGVAGEYASIGYKRTDDGKLLATKVTFGKPEEKGAEKKKDAAPK
jgi:hypothetical protein